MSISLQIKKQSAAVTEASAAVTQMIASIRSITTSSTKRLSLIDHLKTIADENKNKITYMKKLLKKLPVKS